MGSGAGVGSERALPPRRTPLEPLRYPEFTVSWVAGTFAHSANWMQSIAVPYLVYEMTGSATWLGLAAVAGQAPALLGSPLGGVWADRYSRRLLLLWTLLFKSAVAFGFYAMWEGGLLTPESAVVLLLISGFAASVHISTWQPFVAQLVPDHALAPAYRLNAIQFNFSRAAGPALAGWVLAQFGPGWAFLINGFAYVPFLITLLIVRPRPTEPSPRNNPVQEFRDGVRVAFRYRGLVIPILTGAVLSLFGQSLHPLMAGLATDVFGVGAQGFGLMMSSVGMASVVTALAIVFVGERIPRSRQAQFGLWCYALGILVVAATDIYAVGLLGFAITGVAHVLVHIHTTTALQVHLTDSWRGRVTSLYLMGIIASIPVGAQVGGLIGDLVGLRWVVAGFGLCVTGYALYARLYLGSMEDLDGNDPIAIEDPGGNNAASKEAEGPR
ncbi:MFS transporter [Myxococcota bacterium]|nr:MFS transporter [Myxococcota bacterium]